MASNLEKKYRKKQEKQARKKQMAHLREKLKQAFRLNTGKKKAAAAILSASLLGGGFVGGDYAYQEATEKKIQFTVNAIEITETQNCQFSRHVLDQGKKDPAVETEAPKRDCDDKEISYKIHATYFDFNGVGDTKIVFNNASEWLQGKDTDDVKALQELMEVGQKYNGTIKGADFGLVNDQNLIEATKYVPPRPMRRDEFSPLFDNALDNLLPPRGF